MASGTGGITSAGGGFHAEVGSGAYTRWGGYNFGAGNVPTPFQNYTTALDIYLNVDGGWANDTRFDFTSAINNSAGTHLRDFAFNAGFYNDGTGPGTGNRFVVSASNNAGTGDSYPKNPGRDPFAISTSGWYTFEHQFYDNAGILNVDLNIYDASDNLLNTWTLSDPSDVIAAIGGNRYGWFVQQEFSKFAIDNAAMNDSNPVPEPVSLALWVLMGAAAGCWHWRRRK